MRRDRQRGILSVDQHYNKQTTSPKKADILDVVGMIYIGGLPGNYTTKRIGPVLQHTPPSHTKAPIACNRIESD